MRVYFTYKNEAVLTNSTAKAKIEQGVLDKIKLPWFRFSKRGTFWNLEEFDGEQVRIVAKSETLKKLLVPFKRRFLPKFKLSEKNELELVKWVDRQN
ncbi:MAG: hypothetical protein ACXABY_02630 [Candidatus Thorarchaeota archaeon]|jgi:hypothetical protein